MAVLLLVFALTGCGGSDDTTTTTSTTTSDDSNGTAVSGVVKTGGSTSVEKVMNALIYQFQDDNREATIDYEMNGSGDGIKGTIDGLYEIGHSSRELKDDGTEDGLDAIPYAIDGIAIVVNSGNDVADLSTEQLRDIYTGEITNWSEVGGASAPITVVTREDGSGTRDAFAEIIGLEKGGSNIVASASIEDSTGKVQTNVAGNPNAIGYMSYSDVDASQVNTVKYNGVEISEATLKDSSYALKREFLLVTKSGAALSPAAQEFINFILSDAGQKLVADNKLLPIN